MTGSLGEKMRAAAAVAAAWLRLFIEPGQVVELRALNVRQGSSRSFTLAGFYDYEHLGDLAARAVDISRHAEGVYFTLNPLNTALLARRANKALLAEKGLSASDKDVTRRRWLLVDIDPVRPSGVSSNDAEKAAAEEAILAVRTLLRGRGWPEPILADSGNGFHLLYRVDLPADDGQLVARCLWALASQVNTDRVKVDTSVHNPARICKLYGTQARKGDSLPERPHRQARVLEVPSCPDPRYPEAALLSPVPAALLEQLAAEAPPVAKSAPAAGSPTHGPYQHRLKVAEWLADHDVTFKVKDLADGRTAYLLDHCPFNSEHTGKDVAIFQDADGKLGAKCFHASCDGRGWHEFKELIGKPAREHYDPPLPRNGRPNKGKHPPLSLPGAEGEAGDPGLPNEAPDDPFRLARIFLLGSPLYADQCRGEEIPARDLTLRYWRAEWLEWDGAAYRKLPAKEVQARVARRIKQEFDRLNLDELREAKERPRDDGDLPRVRKVTNELVGNTMLALAGLTLLPEAVTPPAWLDGKGPFPAHEVLAASNALVHLPALIAGKPDHGCQPTLNFFSLNALDYPFSLDAPEPRQWLSFLHEVWPDDPESISTLQEWFGYCLTPDTRQQKICMMIGPKRSGKGTSARILRGLVGPENVAGPTLSSLGTTFGLWPLLGKTGAIISDARLSGRQDMAVIVEHSKAATVEESRQFEIRRLVKESVVKAGVWHSGLWIWRDGRTGEVTSSVGYEVDTRAMTDAWLRLCYTITHSGEKISYPIRLQTSRPPRGGLRWWFVCPLIVSGVACQRRAAKLYLPAGAQYFGCRKCHGLTYSSTQTWDKRVAALRNNPAGLEAVLADLAGASVGQLILALKALR